MGLSFGIQVARIRKPTSAELSEPVQSRYVDTIRAQEAPVTISIYNAKGQLVRTLHIGNKGAGVYVTKDKAAYWDGRDTLGEKVASGVYYYTSCSLK